MKITITVDKHKIEKVLKLADKAECINDWEYSSILHVQEQVAKWGKGYKGDK